MVPKVLDRSIRIAPTYLPLSKPYSKVQTFLAKNVAWFDFDES